MKQVEVYGCWQCWDSAYCFPCRDARPMPRTWVSEELAGKPGKTIAPTGKTRKIAVETVTVAPAEPSAVEKAAKAYAEAISEYKVRAEALNKLFAQREEILQQVKDANAARVAASEVVENARKALDNAAWGRE